ncbi:MAG: hypothetical protein ACR2K2_07405 [Mycobacteriales bacterium]
MATPSASYSITVRLEVPADPASVGRLTTAVGAAGVAVTALDVTESHPERIVLDVTCAATDQEHAERLTDALRDVDGVTIRKVSDRTFLLHLGGKINGVRSLGLPVQPGDVRPRARSARRASDRGRRT